jgi:Xaa-Pro aminopeptidase
VATILLHGDTTRHPAMRHEVPLEIIDPFLFVDRDGEPLVLTSALEQARIAEVRPDAHVALFDDFGLYDLVDEGMARDEAELEVLVRALREWGVEAALVSPDLPVEVADRLRAAGIELTVDRAAVGGRRRVKTDAELEGIRRAQRAAEAGMAAAERLIKGAAAVDGRLQHDGVTLTAEMVRDAVRAACAARGAPAPPTIMVVSALSGGGHDPGSGPLPADLPITVDLWPRDEASGCWADMTRTFVNGEISADVAAIEAVVRAALEAARAAARPGITGEALYEVAAAVIEDGGFPTQRTREPGRRLTTGFWFALGHGVGLEVHEAPALGRTGAAPLIAGDVIAVEPGTVDPQDGGMRVEDLLVVTDDGAENLTESFPYSLAP